MTMRTYYVGLVEGVEEITLSRLYSAKGRPLPRHVPVMKVLVMTRPPCAGMQPSRGQCIRVRAASEAEACRLATTTGGKPLIGDRRVVVLRPGRIADDSDWDEDDKD